MNEGNQSIRIATSDDVDSLVEMWWESSRYHEELEPRFQYAPDAVKATREFMAKQIQSENGCFWIAQADEEIVGYVEAMVVERPPIHAHRKVGHLGSIYVKPEARRKGLGTKLWNIAQDWLLSKDVATIGLMVATQNPQALEFWKKLNFREIMVRMELDSD